jgi:hypothetical protein
LQGKVSRTEQFLVEDAGTWTVEKCFNFYFRVFARARQMNSTQPAEEKLASKDSFKFDLKVAIVRSPGLFFGLQTLLRSHPGKIKFDARNFQKSVEKFRTLQKLSNFFQISEKKLLELSRPSLSIFFFSFNVHFMPPWLI